MVKNGNAIHCYTLIFNIYMSPSHYEVRYTKQSNRKKNHRMTNTVVHCWWCRTQWISRTRDPNNSFWLFYFYTFFCYRNYIKSIAILYSILTCIALSTNVICGQCSEWHVKYIKTAIMLQNFIFTRKKNENNIKSPFISPFQSKLRLIDDKNKYESSKKKANKKNISKND